LVKSADAEWPRRLPDDYKRERLKKYAKELMPGLCEEQENKLIKNLEEKTKKDMLDQLVCLPNRVHMLYVVRAMHTLLSSNTRMIVRDAFPEKEGEQVMAGARDVARRLESAVMDDILREIVGDAGHEPEEMKQLLMAFALYHDIGKAIALERHPYEGYHLIADLGAIRKDNIAEVDQLKEMLCPGATTNRELASKSESLFRLFTRPILHHDSFGTVGTGEAPFPIFIDAIELQVRETARHKELLSYLLLATFADIDGTLRNFPLGEKDGLRSKKVEVLMQDWKELCEIIDDKKGERGPIVEELIRRSQDQRRVIERIDRLLIETGGSCGVDKINDILYFVCGGGLQAFCRNFGISKLDYALRFVNQLQKKLSTEKVAHIVISLLNRIVNTYAGFIKQTQDQERASGFELLWLTREDNVRDSIIDTFVDNIDRALSWCEDEITVFPAR